MKNIEKLIQEDNPGVDHLIKCLEKMKEAGNEIKNAHDGFHINYYDKSDKVKGTMVIGQ